MALERPGNFNFFYNILYLLFRVCYLYSVMAYMYMYILVHVHIEQHIQLHEYKILTRENSYGSLCSSYKIHPGYIMFV